MKKLIYLFAITIALNVFTSVSAKAATSTTSSNNDQNLITEILDWLGLGGSSSSNSYSNNSSSNNNSNSASTQLPINNGIVYLLIAGVTIGIVTVKKYKVAAVENQI
jgi:hypothetical protein